MALTVTHRFNCRVIDDPYDPDGPVRPTDWNDTHVITGEMEVPGVGELEGRTWRLVMEDDGSGKPMLSYEEVIA